MLKQKIKEVMKMPNWCYNRLYVYGGKEEIDKFKRSVKNEDTELSLKKVLPMPKKYDKGDAWYDWRCENWGTKWDVEAQLTDYDDEFLCYEFDSAWGPPTSAFLSASKKKYKNLEFRLKYEEPGMCFMGVFKCENGKIIQDECIDY